MSFLNNDVAQHGIAKAYSPVETSRNILKVMPNFTRLARLGHGSTGSARRATRATRPAGRTLSLPSEAPLALSRLLREPCGIHEAPGRVVGAVVRFFNVLGRKSLGGLF